MSGLFLVPLLAGALLGAADRPWKPAAPCSGSSGFSCQGAPIVEAATSAPSSIWKFTRTQGTKDGESFAAIMKTADTTQSDPDFAGLIVRCAPKGKTDVLVALIRPFPPRSRPKVTIAASGGGTLTFDAGIAAAGAAVLLPDEVSAFAAGKWQTTPSLSVVVREGGSEIKGMVALNGLREAYHSLLANCGQ